jgi:hypothetical protein
VLSHLRRNGVRAFAGICAGGVVAALLLAVSAGASTNPGVHGWLRSDVLPVTQPAAVDGEFLIYDGSGRRLHVVALDARSGKTTWSKLASLSDVTPGVAPALDVSGSRVIALLSSNSADKHGATVSSIEARTGAIVWSSPPGRFTSMPAPCPGEPKVVCVTGGLANGTAEGGLRFDVATGKTLAPTRLGAGATRQLGDGLLDPGLRKPDYLVALRANIVSWRKPLAKIFASGFSSDDGWNISRIPNLGLFVGSVGYAPLRDTKTYSIIDLAKQMTAGFRIGSGALVWRNRGALMVCGVLPCPGQMLGGYHRQGDASDEQAAVGLRLRMSGTLKVTYAGMFTPSADAKATIEGFNLANGRTKWRFDAGRSVGLITESLQSPQLGPETIVIQDLAGRYVDLNLRTGAHHRVSRSIRGWCRSAVNYPQAVPYVSAKHTYSTYIGQGALFPCDATGARVRIPKTVPPLVGEIGATSDGLVAWSDHAGLMAVPAA